VTSNQYPAIPETPLENYSEMMSSSLLEALSVPPEIVLPPPSPTQLPVLIDPITAEILPRQTPDHTSKSVPKRKKKIPKVYEDLETHKSVSPKGTVCFGAAPAPFELEE